MYIDAPIRPLPWGWKWWCVCADSALGAALARDITLTHRASIDGATRSVYIVDAEIAAQSSRDALPRDLYCRQPRSVELPLLPIRSGARDTQGQTEAFEQSAA